jgi:hypothetical protein
MALATSTRSMCAQRPALPGTSLAAVPSMAHGLALSALVGCLVAALGCKGNSKVGQSCELNLDDVPEGATINMSAPECKSGLCLKPAVESWPAPTTGATCTAECSSDSDCDGETRNSSDQSDLRCQGGFACAVPFVVGPFCCRHLCVCRDFLGQDSASTPVACQAADALSTCQAAAAGAPASGVAQQSHDQMGLSPRPDIDLVFMITNSASMGPKLSKLSRQLPKMIQALRNPSDGLYDQDLRVAIIDSDLGTGGAYPSGPCAPTANSGGSAYGDVGSFQMRGAAGCGVDSDALWLEYTGGRPQNFARTMDIDQAFGCLVGNLGSAGCEAEHQLQALEFALTKPGLHQDQRGGLQNTFLRPDGFLGLVIISDEDDCSAASNQGMFGDKPELRGESASLRCATRGHQCGGMNLASTPPGYPTSAPFEANLADCAARTDACPDGSDGNPGTDTSGTTDCSPLADVHRLAQEIKGLKADWEEKIIVTGIFGWPRMKLRSDGYPELDSWGRIQPAMADAKYKIDLVPNPDTADVAFPQIWDAWPSCYDPDHEPPRASGGRRTRAEPAGLADFSFPQTPIQSLHEALFRPLGPRHRYAHRALASLRWRLLAGCSAASRREWGRWLSCD